MIFAAIVVGHLTVSTFSKSPTEWTPNDVNSWLGSLGPWAQGYVDRFNESGINGYDLLQLTEADLLDDPLNMRNNLHRRIFFERRQNLNKPSSVDPKQVALDKILLKPVNEWSTGDVALWVGSLDVWSKGYVDRFNESEVNGIGLMQLTEAKLLDRSIGMTSNMHRKKFMNQLKRLTRQYLDETMLIKPHADWSPEDVKLWVESLGMWSKVYADKFHELGIDGSKLIQLKESDLLGPTISMNSYWHREMFTQHLRTLNIVLRSGLWEYKESNSELALFILLGIRNFPRSTLAYLYIFNYADTFLPFFKTLASNKEEMVTEDVGSEESSSSPMSWTNVLLFIPQFLIFPYYLVLRFASYYLEVNYWTSRAVIAHAALLTMEGFSLANLPHLVFKPLFYVGLFSLLSKLLSPVLPTLLTDIVFYWFLYVSPFITLNRMRKSLVGGRNGRLIENNN